MSWRDLLMDTMTAIARSPQAAEALFAPHTRTVRQLQNGESFYQILLDPPTSVARTLVRLIGEEELARIRRQIELYYPDREQLQALRALFSTPARLFGPYEELRRSLDRSISRLLEADHILEQRIQRMIMDGPVGHEARTWGRASSGPDQRDIERALGAENLAEGTRITDGFSVLVPANDITAYGILRELRRGNRSSAPIYYIHQGLGSKTYRMADFIPYRVEGEFTYQELLDATRWVVTREFHLPRQVESLIREDMIDSILHAVQHDDVAAEIILGWLPGRRLSPDSSRLHDALAAQLSLRRLPADFPARFRVVVPRLTETEAYLEVQANMERLLTAASRSVARSR